MSHLAHHPAYLSIEDRIDALGQKYRGQRIVRGLMLWVCAALVCTFVAAIAADLIGTASAGQSRWITAILALWIAWLAASAVAWVVRPMVMRPKALDVARLAESKVEGLHNGLTNTLLLARAQDLQDSPWIPAIFDENLALVQGRPLGDAVKFSDLRSLALRLACVAGPVLLVSLIPGVAGRLSHGLRQMFNPSTFVPRVGGVSEVSVEPGDVTLVAGQPLEVTVTATTRDPLFEPTGKLIFEGLRTIDLTPAARQPGDADSDQTSTELHYTYRAEHIDQTVRYRAEVAGTQSPWYTVTVVPHVNLRELELTVTPPAYTRQVGQRLVLKPEDIATRPVSVPQGSKVDLAATVDVAVHGAMLQAGEDAPTAMDSGAGGLRFAGSAVILDDTPLSVLVMGGAGQIMSRLPDQGLMIHCIKDAPPTIEMKWPTQDVSVPPKTVLKIEATLKDDIGLTGAAVLMSEGPDQPMTQVWSTTYPPATMSADLSCVLDVKDELRKHGQSVRVQVQATDGRDLASLVKDPKNGAPQTTLSPVYEIKFRDAEQLALEQKEKFDRLHDALMKMLALQKVLHDRTVPFKPGDKALLITVGSGQTALRTMMVETAQNYEFDASTKLVQKTLQVMAGSVAREAEDLAAQGAAELVPKEQLNISQQLQARQRQIISTLESLLAVLSAAAEPATQPAAHEGSDMPNRTEKFAKLDEALKEFIKEEQRILDQTANLAKKPVDNFDDKDKALLEQLKQAQDKMDAFMEQALSDFSKNAEQDMSNASLIKDTLAVYSEVTMAKDALNKQSTEVAVSLEEMGLEGAKELQSNIEKWLPDSPDRTKWTQEDPVAKTDTPMPELPKELEDMVGKLMEQQEDLNEQMEDANANWTDSMDKGVGWDAMDGPIADMSAKGVTGNTLPNDNEMGGRSGEGRSGKSQGEFVGDTAEGKGGRNTPTRLDPTPFAKGQIKDNSKDPTGGATGGGKISGEGAAGLEGPVPPKLKQQMDRLATQQAELRNNAERLQLQYHLGRYDNFDLYKSIALMRRTESDLEANRYSNAMRRRDEIVDDMADSKLLLGGTVNVQQDTTPPGNSKMEEEINDAMKGDLPAAWSEALKEYYKKLAAE